MKLKLQNLVNHIAFVVDASGSMETKREAVEKVFDREIDNLKKLSVEMDQETRVTIYLFTGNRVECLVFDMDVMRVKSLVGHYHPSGGTNLMDATIKAVDDGNTLPEFYGDHAHVIYVITDGEENNSQIRQGEFSRRITSLKPNRTLVCMVPDSRAKMLAQRWGFEPGNVSIWDTMSERGVEDVGSTMRSAVTQYMHNRSRGVVSTSNFFTLDTSKLTATAVQNNLAEIPTSSYKVLPVREDKRADEFVESWLKTPYRNGQVYYELMKKETIQPQKYIVIQDRATGKCYGDASQAGSNEVRNLLGLPHHEIKVEAKDHPKYKIFIQSTAPNRKLIRGTEVFIFV